MTENVDVVIVGAGLSGIGGAYYLQKMNPGKKYVILESRTRIGGTWDFFRYPGIRSDSDMQTMGYAFKPWLAPEAISPGQKIRDYVEETAKENGIDKHIRFSHKVIRASWSSQDQRWTLDVLRSSDSGDERIRIACQFLILCAGYYKYDEGYRPTFPGMERFKGTVVHPNQWPESLDYSGKRVVVIGSGATAVTLVPNLAKTASHVTMLQRSPTYIFSVPSKDPLANLLMRVLPSKFAYFLTRWKNIGLQAYYWRMAKKRPEKAKKMLENEVRKHLGESYNRADFTPRYNPWDQRLCLVPDADLFVAIKEKRASIATGEIDTFTEGGVKLKSGKELDADIVVTATGFNMQAFGGIELLLDEKPVDLAKTVVYKSAMFSDLPNLFAVFGYINASWTLKVDVLFNYVCRMINIFDKNGLGQATPRRPRGEDATAPFVDEFSSGYIARGLPFMPRQGARDPWRLHQNYMQDRKLLKFGKIEDDALDFKPKKG